ncbi:redoxin domain-containing protein [Pseudoroseicyclus aestuarii]|uniref:Alkyl hydroperoxide reductase C n=1 Tax=Pseudoroseicyclus aestuarii TaxID=1795041 RepID=A0A318SRU3_9RHOB|nr:redoxin domain-containing protein [Pseudoroseicyclus aestuarii]PYE84661.1 1-Cys peroxiredoxin 6 [Pseudoroseicyclus aestuarii]
MSYQFFTGRGRNGEKVMLPQAFREKLKWRPRIGDQFPHFIGSSTRGTIDFRRWAEGSWVVFFSQPGTFSSVCTTEMGMFVRDQELFEERGIKLIALAKEDLGEQQSWLREIERLYGARVDFPSVEDPTGMLSTAFGMTTDREIAPEPARITFIMDPHRVIRMISEHPLAIGRSSDEFLRTIDALRTHTEKDCYTPGGWRPGDEVLVPDEIADDDVETRYGESRRFNAYLRLFDPARARAGALEGDGSSDEAQLQDD